MQELWLVRHSHKLSYLPDQWKRTARYLENDRDDPLSKYGIKLAARGAKELVKQSHAIKLGHITTIYCSPFERCIQTAVEIVKEAKKSLGCTITITVVYDLGESRIRRPTVYFDGSRMKFATPDEIDTGAISAKSSVDIKMTPGELRKKHSDISGFLINAKRKSSLIPIESGEEESSRMFKAIKLISEKKESTIIVAHSHTLEIAYNYFNQTTKTSAIPTYGCSTESRVNTIIGFAKGSSKSAPFKMIYKPNNKFSRASGKHA